jgi:hypothetical protein
MAWEPEPGGPDIGPESRVTVDFVADGAGTRVELTHTRLVSEQSRHGHGWDACLDNVAGRVFA